MRVNYSEDEDFPGQFELWQANCQRSLKGKAGQAALRELETALLALPEKRLIADKLQAPDGEVCALGALGRFKGVEVPISTDNNYNDDDCLERLEQEEAVIQFGVDLGVPYMVSVAIVERNDGGSYFDDTPEGRYTAMLTWVQRQLVEGERHAV